MGHLGGEGEEGGTQRMCQMLKESRWALCVFLIVIGSTWGDMRKLPYLDQIFDYMQKYSYDNVTFKAWNDFRERFLIYLKKKKVTAHQNDI